MGYFRSGGRQYLVQVVGQSLVEGRIAEGDHLVLEEDEDPPDATVVALLNEKGKR